MKQNALLLSVLPFIGGQCKQWSIRRDALADEGEEGSQRYSQVVFTFVIIVIGHHKDHKPQSHSDRLFAFFL